MNERNKEDKQIVKDPHLKKEISKCKNLHLTSPVGSFMPSEVSPKR